MLTIMESITYGARGFDDSKSFTVNLRFKKVTPSPNQVVSAATLHKSVTPGLAMQTTCKPFKNHFQESPGIGKSISATNSRGVSDLQTCVLQKMVHSAIVHSDRGESRADFQNQMVRPICAAGTDR
jgi:hypothetical protein